jgi:hypothetical protein
MTPIRMLLALLLLPALAAPALAIDRAYLGYWAANATACTPHDAFRITPEGFSAREESCQTKEAHRDFKGWTLRLRCASEGADSNVTLHWQLGQDGRLQETQAV